MKKLYVKIDGIHCDHCITTITNQLLKNNKIKDVVISSNIATISYIGNLTNEEIIDSITEIDYITKDRYISSDINDLNDNIKLKEFLFITLIILLIWFFINKIFGFNIFNVIPKIDSNITYSMLFITGLLTSIHCISMCGAINLIAITNKKVSLKRPILYNTGRVLSYTIIGALAGLIGSVLSFNSTFTGVIIVLAAILMFLMSLSMLGIIHISLPKLKFKNKSRNSFVIGLFNGLMPCGPLQAMQVYALSTGSIFKGALSMFLFGLGTVPLMLSVGFIYNLFKGNKKIFINKIASILILILSIVMLNRGLLSLNIDIAKSFKDYGDYTPTIIKDNYQVIEFNLSYNSYEDILVQKDIPVKMIIHVDEEYLTGCNNMITLKDYNVSKKLEVGENVVEFTPTKTGTFTYTCFMDMIKNNIKVIDDINYFKEG